MPANLGAISDQTLLITARYISGLLWSGTVNLAGVADEPVILRATLIRAMV